MPRRHHGSPLDHPRQLFVTFAAILMLLGWLGASGVLASIPFLKNIPIPPPGGDWLVPGGTLLTPSPRAYWIWLPIFLGLLGYTLWQWRRDHHDDPRYRSSGWWLGGAMLLLAAFPVLQRVIPHWPSLGLLALVLMCSYAACRGLSGDSTSRSAATWVLADVGPGLLLGWITVGLLPNAALALGTDGRAIQGHEGELLAIIIVVVALVLASAFFGTLAGRVAGPAAVALAWGLACIAWARLREAPLADIVGWACVVAAVLALILAVALQTRRHNQGDSGPRRSGRRSSGRSGGNSRAKSRKRRQSQERSQSQERRSENSSEDDQQDETDDESDDEG